MSTLRITDEEITARIAKLLPMHAQEAGARAGEAMQWLNELRELRAYKVRVETAMHSMWPEAQGMEIDTSQMPSSTNEMLRLSPGESHHSTLYHE